MYLITVALLLYPPPHPHPHPKVIGGGGGGGGGILVSLRPPVCTYVRPTSRVRSVAPTVLVGSISYLYILSSNFRRCVACKVSCKISKFEFWGNALKYVTLTLSCFDLGSDVNH